MQNDRSPTVEDVLILRDMIEATRITRAIYVVTRLGVPDLLASGPLGTTTLAESTGAHERSLFRVMRALSNRGIFKQQNGGFALTPRGSLLQKDTPGSLRDWTLWHGSEWSLRAWAEFEHAVVTGEPAFNHAMGEPFFSYLAGNASMAATFDAAMTSIGSQMNQSVADVVDFSCFTTIADIGGGSGSLLATLLRQYPQLHGILFDLPGTMPKANKLFSSAGISDRVTCIGGNFFDAVPANADAYILKAILHDWDNADANTILRNCHLAMKKGTRLFVVDMVVPDQDTPSPIKEVDLQMLAMQTGCERTAAELESLLKNADFELEEIKSTQSPISVAIAVRR